jgi:hypothetical protein
MWTVYDEESQCRQVYSFTIDIYRGISKICRSSSPMDLGDCYDPMWTCGIFNFPLLF